MHRRSVNPAVREFLIAEALAFAKAAQQVAGVTRIALIGSLTTEKPDPKDADVLVTVTDAADLALLARLGRRLQGRAANAEPRRRGLPVRSQGQVSGTDLPLEGLSSRYPHGVRRIALWAATLPAR